MTRHRELLESPELRRPFPIFHDAERVIADPLVRNRGTIGGSLCQADPSEDLSAVCTTLDASCVIRGRGGERVVSMAEFYRGPYETAVGPAEMLTEIRIPVRPQRVQRVREGRPARRRLGGRLLRRRRLDRRRRHHRRPGRAGRGRAEHHRHPRGLPGAARPAAVGGALRRGGRHRGRALHAGHRPARQRRVQAPPRGRADPAGAAAGGRPHRRPAGGLSVQVTMTVNGDEVTREIEGRAAAGALPARPPGPDRHPLGLRHEQLRGLRRSGSTASR